MGKIQGEGDYDSARKFNADETAFVKSGRVDQAARDAEPKSPGEAEDMARAEEAGRRRAKDRRDDVQENGLTDSANPAPESDPGGC
jgi:hypothetical protein